MAKNQNTDAVAVKSNKTANIIVGIVSGIAALIIIAIIVLCSVQIKPLDGFKRPVRYEFYNVGSEDPSWTNDGVQSRIHNAVNDMDFSAMSAVLQWHWDYSYNLVRNDKGEVREYTAGEINNIKATSSAYMVEFIYEPATVVDGEVDLSTCQSVQVDGQTVYFDRVKVLVENTNGNVGEILIYPYIYSRVTGIFVDGGAQFSAYRTYAVKVRANTTDAYAAFDELAEMLRDKNDSSSSEA